MVWGNGIPWEMLGVNEMTSGNVNVKGMTWDSVRGK